MAAPGCEISNHFLKELGEIRKYDIIFATLYRDEIEIIIVQSKYGKVQSNRQKYGAGYDAYIDPDIVEGVDLIYTELKDKGIKIISIPQMTEYGSYEFVIEDIDGRLIGIGRIKNNNQFFGNTKKQLDLNGWS